MCALVEDPADGRVRPGLSGRNAARRPGIAGMGCHAPGRRIMAVSKYLYGPLTSFGVLVAGVIAIADQVTKLMVLLMFGVGGAGPITSSRILDLLVINVADVHVRTAFPVAPVLNLVLTWNTGISYGLFPQVGPLGQWALLAIKGVAVVLLWLWLS